MTILDGTRVLATAFTVLCVGAVASLLQAERKGLARQKRVSKTVASGCFLGVALCFVANASHAEYSWIIAGLALGAIGDVALLFSGTAAFLAGLSAFLAGHVA